MAISTIGTDALASAAVTSAKLASGAPSRSQLPAGTVLQVVSYEYVTAASYSVNGAVANTGITTSITPTTSASKILLLASVSMTTNDVAGGYYWGFKRGSTMLGNASGSTYNYQFGFYNPNNGPNGGGNITTYSATYLDSPGSTSSQTYTVYVAGVPGTTTLYINQNSANNARNTSTITLVEIAA